MCYGCLNRTGYAVKITTRRVGITAGAVIGLGAFLWYYDRDVPKPIGLAVWKERLGGWHTVGENPPSGPNEFIHSGTSSLVLAGQPDGFCLPWGARCATMGSAIRPIGESHLPPPPPALAERDKLYVLLLRDTGREAYRYDLHVVTMYRD